MATTANSISNEARSIVRLSKFDKPGIPDITIFVDGEPFDIIKQNKEKTDYELQQGNELVFKKNVLVAQLVNASPEFADYIGNVGSISPILLCAYLRGAKIVFDHTYVNEGDTITQFDGEESAPFEHNGYSNTIHKIEFRKQVLDKMAEAFDKICEMEFNNIFGK